MRSVHPALRTGSSFRGKTPRKWQKTQGHQHTAESCGAV